MALVFRQAVKLLSMNALRKCTPLLWPGSRYSTIWKKSLAPQLLAALTLSNHTEYYCHAGMVI